MTELTAGLVLAAGLIALLDWRKGLALCVLIGIAQDPLRKLAPNQPIYYVVLVGFVFGAAWLRAYMVRVPLSPGVIQGWRRDLRLPFTLFVLLVLAQATHSFGRFGSITMTGIGLLVWLAPIPAVVLSYQYALRRGVAGVRQLLKFYVFFALISLGGVYLEYSGVQWRTLGEVGEGLVIYDVGTVLKAYSGFFRSSEIAAWHTAAIACFVFVLAVGKRATLVRVALALGMIGVLVSLGILTGRRKMLVEISVFLSVYFFLVAWLQRGAARLAAAILIAGAVGYVGIVGFVAPDLVQRSYTKTLAMENAKKIQGYAVRGQSVFVDLPARVNELGVQPILWAVDAYGWLGAGLGTGSQGVQAVAEAHDINRGAAEGGLGKITMELGIPGLLIALWLLVALSRHVRRLIVVTASISPQHARMAYGMVAFLVANAATFSVATQAYSDLFVLLLLGWSLGFLLAMPVLAARGDGVRRRTRQPGFAATPQGPMFAPTLTSFAAPRGGPAHLGSGPAVVCAPPLGHSPQLATRQQQQ